MDVVYLLKHSRNQDFEIRQSLRSLGRHAPYIRKVWIFGDRPAFISHDTSLIEHVPHDHMAWLVGVKTPVRNFFLLNFLASLIPELSFEYLRFSDDFFLLADYPIEEARKDRYFEDLTPEPTRPRGTGLWKQNLWYTRDTLVRLGYTAYNFEIHAPMYFTRKRVFDAYREFRDFVSEERWQGMLGATAILNHAHKHEGTSLVSLKDERRRGGFWGKPPASYEAVLEQARGKTFFNFDDLSFNDDIKRFLEERFPQPSKYERRQQ